jgi:hypothetical protein
MPDDFSFPLRVTTPPVVYTQLTLVAGTVVPVEAAVPRDSLSPHSENKRNNEGQWIKFRNTLYNKLGGLPVRAR